MNRIVSPIDGPIVGSMMLGDETALTFYDPGMMTYDGANDYYSATPTTSGSLATAIIRTNIASFSGGGSMRLFEVAGSTPHTRLRCDVYSSDHATTALRNKCVCFSWDDAGVKVLQVLSVVDIADGIDKTIFIAFNATTGAVILTVNGVNSDNTLWGSRVLGTGTLDVGAGAMGVGAGTAGADKSTGDIGFFGYRDAYLTNPTDFYNPVTGLQELDESSWTEWGAQPLFWNKSGTMTANTGSGGSMTENGSMGTTVGDFYDFPLMTFAGGAYQDLSMAYSGNLVSALFRFKVATFAGSGVNYRPIACYGTGGIRMLAAMYSSDYTTSTRRNKLSIICQNTSAATICRIFTTINILDNAEHTCLAGFDAGNGTASLIIDGNDVLDTGNAEHTLATGALPTAAGIIYIGADNPIPSNNYLGDIGFFGIANSYLTNHSDFMSGSSPIALDTTTWTEFGSQPLIFQDECNLGVENLGSTGTLTKNGTITGPA